jgi:SAM-dependent methyltransferase
MKVIGRFQGALGEIAIWESLTSGDRLYLEGEIFQSRSSPSGESRLPYVQMFRRFLQPANNVLLLGCGGGNLATMLARTGKRVVVVDCNPTSFDIAREYFGMPKQITCVTVDFRRFVAETDDTFDGIDVGGPKFCYREQFDPATCSAIVGRIDPGGACDPQHARRKRPRRCARRDRLGPVGRQVERMDPGPPRRTGPKRPDRFPARGAGAGQQAAHRRAPPPRSDLGVAAP